MGALRVTSTTPARSLAARFAFGHQRIAPAQVAGLAEGGAVLAARGDLDFQSCWCAEIEDDAAGQDLGAADDPRVDRRADLKQAWTTPPDGIAITVRVTPRASKDLLAAGTPEHFVARLAAPPVDGAANAALIPLVARTFGVAKRSVTLLSGETSRLKRISVAGDPSVLAGIAATLYGAPHDG